MVDTTRGLWGRPVVDVSCRIGLRCYIYLPATILGSSSWSLPNLRGMVIWVWSGVGRCDVRSLDFNLRWGISNPRFIVSIPLCGMRIIVLNMYYPENHNVFYFPRNVSLERSYERIQNTPFITCYHEVSFTTCLSSPNYLASA